MNISPRTSAKRSFDFTQISAPSLTVPSLSSSQMETLPDDDDGYGKILLKGKLIPRKKKMKRKSITSKPLTSSHSNRLASSPGNSFQESSTSSSSNLLGGNSLETAETEKIPVIGAIGPIEIDAAQVLLFGEVHVPLSHQSHRV